MKKQSAQLLSRTQVAENTYLLTFVPDQEINFRAGQYIWLQIPLEFEDEKGDRRAFSICSSPSEKNISIVFRGSTSGYKRSLIALSEGDTVHISGPFGSFTFPEDRSLPVVCLVGGVGIAPIMSILWDHAEYKIQRKIILVCANSNPQNAVFVKELDELRHKIPDLSVQCVSRFDETIIQPYYDLKPHWYVVGPERMCMDVGQILLQHHEPVERLHFEEFYPIGLSQDALTHTIDTYKLAVDSSTNHIIITDSNGRITYANQAAQQITGFSFSEMMGQTPRLWGGLMSDEFYQKFWQSIKYEQKPFYGEITNRRKNGEHYIAIARVSPIIKDSLVIGFVGTEEDITERVKVEEAFRQVNERFQGIYKSSKEGIVFTSLEGDLLEVNQAFCDLTGYTREELAGKKTYQEITPPEFADHESHFINLLKEKKEPVEYEKEYQRKDGGRLPISLTAFLVHDSHDQVIGMAAIIRDITDRKLYEEQLRHHAQKLEEEKQRDEAILASIGEGMIIFDAQARAVKINEAAEKVLQIDGQEFVGKSFLDDYPMYDEQKKLLTKEERPLYQALKTGQKQEDILVSFINDKQIYIGVTITPIVMYGSIVGAIEVFRDMTKLKEIDRMKTEFISLASHQLRTPLSAIRWFTEMLLDGDIGEFTQEQQQYIQNIADSNQRMIMLVNSLLNISRIESGRLMIDPSPHNMKSFLKDVVDELQIRAQQKGMTIKLEISEDLPQINLDERLVREVYLNLLTNSIKYSPKDTAITIRLWIEGDQLFSSVQDSGYGIPAHEHPHIFDKFFRAENIITIETDGTGLGLYLTKQIVEASGGKVWFESTENQGSTFYFTLPIAGVPKREGEVTLS